jgi:D-alanyl-lipoteichoic acid acyltransferase DltB (MBOAT superfamily)
MLAYFKYVNFFVDTLAGMGVASAAALAPLRVSAAIPLGISFYTFQTLSYTIDVYRRERPACRSASDLALYVSFFPHLIAGPILRSNELLPQIRHNAPATLEETLTGIELTLLGLVQKVVIADNLALLVDPVFASPQRHSGPALALAALAFLGQIYCDFAGYSTMARGLALMLGYHLPINFDYPLLARNPIEYRRAWHISMGRWFRDYVYRPLGGDRGGPRLMVVNTLITWALFGLWHGASWTFLLWGLYHGTILAAYRLARGSGLLPPPSRATAVAGFVAMPLVLGLSSVLFRSADLHAAGTMLGRILRAAPGVGTAPGWTVLLVGLYLAHWASKLWYREGVLARAAWPARVALTSAAVLVLVFLAGAGQPFYYFQF